MATSTSSELTPAQKAIQAKAASILEQVQKDPKLKEKVRADPMGYLKSQGLSEKAAADFIRETNPPAGKIAPQCTCNDFTCIISRCPASCYVTVCGSTFRGPFIE